MIGYLFQRRRRALGLNVETVARRSMLWPGRLNVIERGNELPEFTEIKNLCAALDLDLGAVTNTLNSCRFLQGEWKRMAFQDIPAPDADSLDQMSEHMHGN